MQSLLGVGSGRDDIQLCRQRVGAFGLTGELATQPIAVLSGGQKARIQFARVCATSPHVLVLDEPTNHLDLESIRSLADAVTNFEGAVVIVSHDEQLLSLACTQVCCPCCKGRATQARIALGRSATL